MTLDVKSEVKPQTNEQNEIVIIWQAFKQYIASAVELAFCQGMSLYKYTVTFLLMAVTSVQEISALNNNNYNILHFSRLTNNGYKAIIALFNSVDIG